LVPNYLRQWDIGDTYCDDELNNPECNYDGGDCCGSGVKAGHCVECACYENCVASFEWIGDGYCDDAANNDNCNFDGGDCCNVCINTDFCSECVCHQINVAGIQTGEYYFILHYFF
jgi:hypothetical protein